MRDTRSDLKLTLWLTRAAR